MNVYEYVSKRLGPSTISGSITIPLFGQPFIIYKKRTTSVVNHHDFDFVLQELDVIKKRTVFMSSVTGESWYVDFNFSYFAEPIKFSILLIGLTKYLDMFVDEEK